MSIRAYKLAEELGIERHEFVEKAAEVGVELKSPMAALEPAVADELRQKLGKKTQIVVEERVEAKGTAILRRRRRREPEPEPEPEPVAEEVAAPPASEPTPEPVVAEEAQPELQAEAPVAAEPEPEPAAEEPARVEPVVRPVAPAPPAPPPPAGDAATAPGDRRKQRKRVREVVNLQEQEQLARQSVGRSAPRRATVIDPRQLASPRRRRRDAPSPRPKPAARTEQRRVIRVEGDVSVGELAKLLGSKAAEIQARLMALGTMVSINQTIDVETARQVATQLGYEVEDVGFKEEEFLEEPAEAADESKLPLRPPIVTVMGHVDHGKTSLLDAIRKANVVAGEAGGITQHIGAYQARAGDSTITFIDTPGHAAFTSMRARGAQVTDLVVLVVAATEGIMPQTVEAIDHARAAGCPIIVAVNKIDLPGADSRQTRQRLMEHGLVPEDFGGDVQCVDVSALKGTGIEQLLEAIALQAEILELRADPEKRARGVVLEAELDRGRGPVATVLVQDGTLQRGDVIVVGTHWGRVRAMQNEHGQTVKEAGPSVPVQVIGLSGVPDAGALVHAVENEKVAKQIVGHRESQERARSVEPAPRRMSLEELFSQEEGETKELNVVLKADVHGTCEAVRDSLEKLSTERVKLNVILSGVGGITESDVMLASASNAIIVGFHVRPDSAARRAAEGRGVEVRIYQVIYELLDEMKAAMAGLLPPTVKETFLGRAEVRETFSIPRVGTVAGCYIAEGLMRRNSPCRLIRDGVQIYEGRIGSLRRFKEDVREVQTGFECGVGIEGYNDVKVGDAIEAYTLEEQAAEL